ncbi:sodium:sulfate symporter [Polaribacter sp. SA4-10]|uniref:SLC13 family permease n=1 Tax=Polaribacter sp. SA4-10 TaxID=754397 RepID=UPI000B3C9473|nr:SLC13 family permease [Polaribacter sp. SA4-10]ARV06236.1 sodium:sulfate symporter [Polaribacter sp. SA4-10]
MEAIKQKKEFDVLDMRNYRMEKLPIKEKSKFEKFLVKIGGPLAILSFILLLFFIDIPFLEHINTATLSKSGKANFDAIGLQQFIHSNKAMLAIFVASLILWITEAIPNYLTSLILIITLVLTKVLPEEVAYAQLGHKVMWLNIMSFILASMLVATGIAKRFALWFILKFGKNASSVMLSFMVINIILSLFISATTAKAAILLPIMMVVAAVYGASKGDRNNFGRNLIIQNLFQINMGASSFLTGSGANLLAASLIAGAIGTDIFFSQWMLASFPVALGLMLIGWIIGTKIIFPIPKEERLPSITGGMESLKKELESMGEFSFIEVKSIIIFSLILGFWITDRWHGISPTAVAFVGAIVALLPRIGIIKWNDVDIPWHLLLFSAGAYTLGAGFNVTDLPSISVNAFFDALGFSTNTPFWVLYIVLTGVMIFSSLLMQSKTMRTMIFIPIAIGIATRFNFEIISLALPMALLIEHVYVLPFNSKPGLLLYSTNHYSMSDAFKFGFSMQCIAWITSILMAMTYYKWLEITPNGLF